MSDDARTVANQKALGRLTDAEPVLVDVRPALDVVPGMQQNTILTSGAVLPWDAYTGPQRMAILYGAVYEGLASNPDEADQMIRAGEIEVGFTHDHGCVGSVAGIYTASMPVFVVVDRAHGNRGFCNFYEGESHRRLNYGSYGQDVVERLDFVAEVLAPTIGEAVSRAGGVELRPIIKRAIHLGDELHSRNTAATLLFSRALFPSLLDVADQRPKDVRETLTFLAESDYFFLRLAMASSKATADAAHGVERSSVVTAMTLSCREFAIRVSGLDGWHRGPLPTFRGKLFDGVREEDVAWMGGESHITETVGLGGFAQAAAFPLQAYQGGSPEAMIRMNEAMYDITVGEHPHYRIPYFAYRGTPVGIDVFEVLRTGTTPVIDAGLGTKDGGQAGAGFLEAPIECFEVAAHAYETRYGP
jgi:hypothetical protein